MNIPVIPPLNRYEIDWRQVARATLAKTAMADSDRALVRLGCELLDRGYRFTTVIPATHRQVIAREAKGRASLDDIFG